MDNLRQRVIGRREPTLERHESGVEDRTIGRILLDMGKLKSQDVARVFALHRKKGMRFGEAARRLKLVGDDDIRYALSVQFNYPYLKPGQGVLGPELIVAHEPFDAQAEALRDLRTQLLLQWLDPGRKVLAIVSAMARDGRSYLAANLAVAFAQLGEKTLLIDADLRVPRQHRIFGLPNAVGLAQVLSGRAGAEVMERISYFENLALLSAGAVPPNPLELLSRRDFVHFLEKARKDYAVILVDTPAAARGSDARMVSARSDGVLMVARQHQTKITELDALRRAVTEGGAQVVGTVLNRV
ncbi:MAG: chain length determinant protein tyrosine kinase EpsG [Burkholderiales bacterium]|nr:chain length determinant protein tyrosine kinase EpsG [Burkholderiales bacterium]